MRKRYRKGKKVDEGHVIYKWQGQGSNQHLLNPRPNFSLLYRRIPYLLNKKKQKQNNINKP